MICFKKTISLEIRRSTSSLLVLIDKCLIVSGASVSGMEIARLCSGDTYLPNSYLSATNVVTFQFISDVSITTYGFLATVEASKAIMSIYFNTLK